VSNWEIQSLGALGVVAVFMLWAIGQALKEILAQLFRANKYLQHLCWREDQARGVAAQDWVDPGG
jgi:hypothetical protein